MRVGAIDIGTNSVLCLIAEKRDGKVEKVTDVATITRLGQGVDASGALAPEAIARTLDCLERYGALLKEHGVEKVDAVGTSALRDAGKGSPFVQRAETLLGSAPRVISGEEEARLTFAGATSGLAEPLTGRVGVFDIGGGSTELIVGTLDGAVAQVDQAVSLDIGAVRLTERLVDADPPSPANLDALRAAAAEALAGSGVDMKGLPLIGVAGTVTTLAAIVHGVVPYDGDAIHGATLALEALDQTMLALAAVPLTEREKIPGLPAKRADVIIAGAAIASEVAKAAGSDGVRVSDRGVRWGVAAQLLS